MDSQTVQLPALRGDRTRSPEDLQGSYAKALIALELELREERENTGDPDHLPGVAYARATGALQSIARNAIAVAQFQRDEREKLRHRCTELEDQIRELEDYR